MKSMRFNKASNVGPTGGSFPPAIGLVLSVALAWVAAASPDTALKAYEKGDYRRARAEFERLAKEKPDDPRLRFNAGDAAYRQQDYTNATAHFETVLGAPDLSLQEQAYYNLGNTRYQLGTKATDPQAKLQSWQQAVTNYSSAIKLDPRDTNALSNLSFVQKQVEELMKQMPKQPQQNQKQDKQDKQDKKDQDDSQQANQDRDQNQDQQKQDQKDQKDSPQNQSQKSQQAQKPDQKPDQNQDSAHSQKPDQKQNEQAQSDLQKGGKKDDQQAQKESAGQQPGDKSPDSAGQPQGAEAGKPGEMNAAQAGRMLDEQKGDEKALVFQAGGNGKEAAERPRKNRKKW